MNDYELKAIISSEIQSSLGYLGGELTEARAKSLDYYFSEPFGNEQEGRSQVISTDVADTIEKYTASDYENIYCITKSSTMCS